MFTIIIRDTQFNISAIELDNLLKTSYYHTYTTNSNGSQRQIHLKGIDSFSIVAPHCTDKVLELVQQYCHPLVRVGY